MSEVGNVAALVDGQTHHAFMWNEKNMVYAVNKSGGARTSGEVVIRDTGNADGFTRTTTVGDIKVLGVIPQIDDVNGLAGTQTIPDNGSGFVQTLGNIDAVQVTAATAIGQYLIASATAGKADPTSVYRSGVFAIATSASAGAGTVSALLIPVEIKPQLILLSAPLMSASWAASAKSTTARALLDLSAVFGAPPGIAAVLLRTVLNDSGSAGATDGAYLLFSPVDATGGIAVACNGVTNDAKVYHEIIVPCNADGDVYITIAATGAGTLDCDVRIWGYWL